MLVHVCARRLPRRAGARAHDESAGWPGTQRSAAQRIHLKVHLARAEAQARDARQAVAAAELEHVRALCVVFFCVRVRACAVMRRWGGGGAGRKERVCVCVFLKSCARARPACQKEASSNIHNSNPNQT